MTQLSEIRMSPAHFADRETATPHTDKYHPHCGEEHSHKPAKAIIGIGLLLVLSFLLYEFNGKAPDHQSANPAPVAHHVMAWNAH